MLTGGFLRITAGPPEFGVTEDAAEAGLEGEALMVEDLSGVDCREGAAAEVEAFTTKGEATALGVAAAYEPRFSPL